MTNRNMVITECTEHNEVVDIEFPIYMKSEYNDSEVEDYSHVLYTRVAEDDTFVSISIDTYGGKSEYSINCVTNWFPTWVKKNKLEDKKNIDLIRPIYQYYHVKHIVFRHINSHTGLQDVHSLGNEEADRLATNGMNIKPS